MRTKTAQATPPEDLREQILSPNVAKNEREWWASKEIQRLQGELDEANEVIEHWDTDQERANKAEAERDKLKEVLEKIAKTDSKGRAADPWSAYIAQQCLNGIVSKE